MWDAPRLAPRSGRGIDARRPAGDGSAAASPPVRRCGRLTDNAPHAARARGGVTDATVDGGAAGAPVLEMRGIAKRFGATQALEDVSLALRAGEVHALLGENGAGKSTLIKIMTGVHQPDRGEILLAGQPVAIRSAAEAQRHGIAAIYQEPLLFPDLNVAENIFIGHQDRGAVADWRRMFREAERDPGRARRRARRAQPGARPDARRAAVGRDRQGDLAQRPRPDHGRADRVALGPRGRAALQARARPARPAASRSSSSATAWRRCSRSPTRSRSSATGG